VVVEQDRPGRLRCAHGCGSCKRMPVECHSLCVSVSMGVNYTGPTQYELLCCSSGTRDRSIVLTTTGHCGCEVRHRRSVVVLRRLFVVSGVRLSLQRTAS